MSKPLQPGDVAPDFTLLDSDRNPVSLAGLRGRPVVLAFFPFAFTSTCTSELCALRDDLPSYKKLKAEVLGISVDSPYSLKRFREEQQLPFQLLSDFNKEVSAAYGCIYDQFLGLNGVSKRAAFVINEAGKIAYAEVLEDAGKVPDFKAIQQALGMHAAPVAG